MRVGRREQCLFCDAPADSVEDVWPQWILRTVGPRRLLASRTGANPESRRVKSLKLKARIVCTTCNNTWMSRLEQSVKPHLTPMLKPQNTKLERMPATVRGILHQRIA